MSDFPERPYTQTSLQMGVLSSFAVLEAPAVVAGFDDLAVMGQPVEQRRGHLGVAEHLRPFAKREIGGDHDRGVFVQAADEMEQQLSAGLRERQVAELVEHNQINARQRIGEAPGTLGLGFGFELVDQIDDVEGPRLGALISVLTSLIPDIDTLLRFLGNPEKHPVYQRDSDTESAESIKGRRISLYLPYISGKICERN